MKDNTKKRLGHGIFALVVTVMIITVYLLDPTFAWFSDGQDFLSEGELPELQIDILDTNDISLTSIDDYIYTGPEAHQLEIKVKNIDTSSIPVIVRVVIIANWSDGLPVYNNGNTLSFQFNSSNWTESSVDSVGFNNVYYNGKLEPNDTAVFLTGITFPVLPEDYMNKTLSISISAVGLQASSSAVNLWKSEDEGVGRAPMGWDPLA